LLQFYMGHPVYRKDISSDLQYLKGIN